MQREHMRGRQPLCRRWPFVIATVPGSAPDHDFLRRRPLCRVWKGSTEWDGLSLPTVAGLMSSGRCRSRILIKCVTKSETTTASSAQVMIPKPITAVALIENPMSMPGC